MDLKLIINQVVILFSSGCPVILQVHPSVILGKCFLGHREIFCYDTTNGYRVNWFISRSKWCIHSPRWRWGNTKWIYIYISWYNHAAICSVVGQDCLKKQDRSDTVERLTDTPNKTGKFPTFWGCVIWTAESIQHISESDFHLPWSL